MKIFLTFMLTALLHIAGFGQSIFGTENSIWHYENVPDLDVPGMSYTKFEKEKDTFYQGQNCVKISSVHYYTTGTEYKSIVQQPIFFYSNSDTVFYYNNVYHQFYPIYIFNVTKGDSITLHIPYPLSGKSDSTFTTYIDSVITENVDGQTLRFVYTSKPKGALKTNFHLGNYAERIGSIGSGNILGINVISPIMGFGALRCFKDIDIEINRNLFGELECDYLLPLAIHDKSKNKNIDIYPNPFENYINISNEKLKEELTIQIIDIYGQTIVQQHFDAQANCILNTKDLRQGCYIIKFWDNQNIEKGSKIIIKQ